ncbi:MAG: IS3 family transposase [Magnetovibrio sp.]|nr:IS3 family transposase [Magnetovibrio sp.]
MADKVRNYINNFYNSRKRHSALGNISPMRYENMAA